MSLKADFLCYGTFNREAMVSYLRDPKCFRANPLFINLGVF